MKKIRFFLPMLLILLGIGVAFTVESFTKPAPLQETYYFIGDTPAEQSNPDMYVTDPSEPPTCNGSNLNCEVTGTPDPDNPGHPIISSIQVLSKKP